MPLDLYFISDVEDLRLRTGMTGTMESTESGCYKSPPGPPLFLLPAMASQARLSF